MHQLGGLSAGSRLTRGKGTTRGCDQVSPSSSEYFPTMMPWCSGWLDTRWFQST